MAKYQAKLPTFASTTSLKFEGGAELQQALAALPDRVSRRITFAALRDAAEIMRQRMADNAPDTTGGGVHLADQILVKAARVPGNIPAVAVGPSKGTFYGGFLEFGTVKLSARPFARPAFDTTVDTVINEIGRLLWLELAAKGVHRTARVSGPVIAGPGGTGLL
jgi:HK97 gp10 family phage protein